jgi:hypothetical protein
MPEQRVILLGLHWQGSFQPSRSQRRIDLEREGMVLSVDEAANPVLPSGFN